MHYPASTSNGSNKGSSSSAWSYHTSSSSVYLPRTPTIGIANLPPSPATPNNNYAGGAGAQPTAPFMGSVSLPPSEPGTPGYYTGGLATPPESPANASRRMHSTAVVHPILAYSHAPSIYFNVTRPTRELVVRPSYTSFNAATFEESAFQTPVPSVTILVPDLGAEIQVGGAPSGAMAYGHPSRPVTVSTVISTLGLWLSQVATREECKALSPSVMAAAAQCFQARTQGYPGSDGMRRFDLLCGRVFFAGLSRSNDGPNRWVVHLSSRV